MAGMNFQTYSDSKGLLVGSRTLPGPDSSRDAFCGCVPFEKYPSLTKRTQRRSKSQKMTGIDAEKEIYYDMAEILQNRQKIQRNGETRMEYELIHSSRKTLAIQIAADGKVTVRVPMRCSRAKAESFIEEKKEWILRKQKELRLRAKEQEQKREQLPILSEEDYQNYRMLAEQVFRQRAAYFAGQMGVSYGRITIRDQKTRWGSCSSKGNLNFNWRLVLAPREVLDYVVVHELAHRKEMNHSARFWRLVEEELPDYPQRKNWLRVNGELLMRR